MEEGLTWAEGTKWIVVFAAAELLAAAIGWLVYTVMRRLHREDKP